MDVISLTQGLPGAGKTYTRGVCFLLEFLAEEDGMYYHNLPLRHEKFVQHFREEIGEQAAQRVLERLHRIPEEVELSWQMAESGPWDYFGERDMSNAWIAFDEAHTIADKDHPKQHRTNWKRFCGELRHRGCQLELITQDSDKLCPDVLLDVGIRRTIQSSDEIPDELMEIPQGDWNQLRAAITGEKKGSVIQLTERKGFGRKWIESERKMYPLKPELFEYYDSYAKPKNGGVSGRKKEPWEQYTKVGIFAWFVRRNAENLILKNPLVRMLLLVVVGVIMLSLSKSSSKRMFANRESEEPKKVERVEAIAKPVQPALPPAVAQLQPIEPQIVLAAVTGQSALMSDGSRKWIGEEIDGKKIVGMDADNGLVFLSGKRLRLGETGRIPEAGVSRRSTERHRPAAGTGAGRNVGSQNNVRGGTSQTRGVGLGSREGNRGGGNPRQ